jgi:GntR family transcriptional regulator
VQYSIEINPHDTRPIWRQIEEGLRRLVTARILEPGAQVPSVREMASELRVNPATVSKAYQRLVGQGVLEVRRGEGTFVSPSPPKLSDGELRSLLQEEAERVVAVARSLGANQADVERTIQTAWKSSTKRDQTIQSEGKKNA